MKKLSHFDDKSQSFWPSQVGRYALDNITYSSHRLLHFVRGVGYTLLVPANIRATTRRYGEVSRTQITLCHATVLQIRYPGKISLPILIKFAFSLWCQSFFSLGAPPSHIPRMWKTAPEIIRRTLAIIQSESATLDTRSASVFTDRLRKICARRFNDLIWGPWVRVVVEP